ncbi:hypothetical protein DHD05_08070 [Arenibacter sp. N53]|uniref:hypothetical protein n=1 Tax=Arenibacter TaxID=178469 RepID=UPI000CD3C148|nr:MULTISPECIES: hypothetical protein [Arenibacter]MCM4151542.1 hypothetical protein [Arenibacter sp. N53]
MEIDDFEFLDTPEIKLQTDFFEMEMLTQELDRAYSRHDEISDPNLFYKSIEHFQEAITLKNVVDSKVKELNILYEQFLKTAEENNLFWNYCSERIYTLNFKNFEKSFFTTIPNAKRIEFLFYEISALSREENIKIFTHSEFELDFTVGFNIDKHLSEEHLVRIQFENKRKIEFVEEEIKNEGYHVVYHENGIELKKITKEDLSDEEFLEEPLKIKDLPLFDTLDRFTLIKELKIDDIIHNLETSQKSKYKVLALIMGIHPDNARKLLTNKYPKLKTKEEYSVLRKAANSNVQAFLNNPNNDIKIP